jgi:hypothetical protein
MIRKLTVITNEKGHVVGTHIGHGVANPATGTTTSLVAGPGQTLHRVEFEMPLLTSRADIEDFHRRLTEHLRKK